MDNNIVNVIKDKINTSPYEILCFSGMLSGSLSLIMGCCITPMAMFGSTFAIVYTLIFFVLPFSIACLAIPNVVKHTLSGEPYPSGNSAYAPMPLFSIAVFVGINFYMLQIIFTIFFG